MSETTTNNWFGIEDVVFQVEPTKICKSCGERKPRSSFHRNRWRKGGRMDSCKDCTSKRSRKYYRTKGNLKTRMRSIKTRDPESQVNQAYIEYLWNKQGGRCYYSGFQMTNDPNHKDTWSVNRVDSSKGYTIDNIVLCCRAVNMMKQDLDLPDFYRYIVAIYEHAPQKEEET